MASFTSFKFIILTKIFAFILTKGGIKKKNCATWHYAPNAVHWTSLVLDPSDTFKGLWI